MQLSKGIRRLIITITVAVFVPLVQAQRHEFDEIVMRSTFKIESGGSIGTSFLVLVPQTKDPNVFRYTLVSAAHVFESMPSSNAVLHMRSSSTNGQFLRLPSAVSIRDVNGNPKWVKHPQADVAVLLIGIPNIADVRGLPFDLFATEKYLDDFKIHPGDELRSLGYPLSLEGPVGFPILRSGRIASYPLIPIEQNKTFLIDLPVLPGNSGGPYANRKCGFGRHRAYHWNNVSRAFDSTEVLIARRGRHKAGPCQFGCGGACSVHQGIVGEAPGRNLTTRKAQRVSS
jgi:hypothetical protein